MCWNTKKGKLNKITLSNKRKKRFFWGRRWWWYSISKYTTKQKRTKDILQIMTVIIKKKSELYFILSAFAMLVPACTWLTNSCFAKSGLTKLSTF